MKKQNVYLIDGGFQWARQEAQTYGRVTIQKAEKDWPERSQTSGSHAFTNVAWDTDLESLKTAVAEWVHDPYEIEIK